MSSKLLVTGVVLFYLLVALSIVVANKWVLNATPSVPLFFLWTQLFLATLLFIIAAVFRILPNTVNLANTSIATSKALLPLISLNTLSLVSSTVTLQHVDTSFYQVARGLLLPCTVITSLVFLNSKPSSSILFSCTIVTLGFFVGVLLDGTPISIKGVWWGVLSSLLTSVHSVVIKRSLAVPGIGGSALLLGWYSNLGSAVMLLPIIILVGEVPGVLHLFGEQQSSGSPFMTFIWGSLIAGTLGFLMCLSSLLSIKVTSPITHMVSSAVRGVAGSLLGVWIFGDIITSGRATSIATILIGSIMYTWFRHKEQEADARKQDSSSSKASESNGHEYQKLPRDDGEDIEMGATEKIKG